MVLSQYESNQDYKLRAVKFHECALEISDLYNQLRIFKTLGPPATDEEIRAFCSDITKRYEAILCKYENHLPIDYDMFRVSKVDYFTEFKEKARRIKLKSWWMVYGWYTLLLIGTPLVFIGLSFVKF